jgi:hypothetical protein
MKKMFWAAASATVFISSAALAIVSFDPATGTGFVGKGDVQLSFGGMNNKQIQTVANSVGFRANSTSVTEVSWECTNTNNDKVQERAQTTTSSVQGIVTTVARENSKGKDGAVTGFFLNGYIGNATTTSTSTEGPAVNSCPNSNGTWFLSTAAGDPVEVSSSSTLEVTKDGTNYVPVIEATTL